MLAARRTVYALGFAGLLPFVIPALILALNLTHSVLVLQIVNAYAFGIVCFLCGTWWGMTLKDGNRQVLLLSNFLFLVAFFVFCFFAHWWALAACVLLAGLFIIERNSAIVPQIPDYYRKMRALLTLVAGGSMLVVHLAR